MCKRSFFHRKNRKAINAKVSNASAPSTPPIMGPRGGLDEVTVPEGIVVADEGIVVADEGIVVADEGIVVADEGSEDVAIGGVTAKKSRKMVESSYSRTLITNVCWESDVNSGDWKNRTRY